MTEPTTDQAALRHLLAQALARHDAVHARYSHGFANRYGVDPETDGFVDAMAAVMGVAADRGVVLREAADAIDAETRRLKADEVLEPDKYRPCRDASTQLRRMAAEARGAQQDQAWDVPDARPGTTDHTLTRAAFNDRTGGRLFPGMDEQLRADAAEAQQDEATRSD